MNRQDSSAQEVRFLTPTTKVLIVVAGLGLIGAGLRFVFGLGATTNLSDAYPWGLWKAFNVVAGIAVAAGGFTTAAFVHVFHRHRFHAIARTALLAAALGYTFAVLGLIIDIGRYYNIWHPILPSMWQGDSVLFEVAMCVMAYLTVLYIEFLPVLCERMRYVESSPRLVRMARLIDRAAASLMPFLLAAGVVISCLHQSSLGNLMLIARGKMHPLWDTPILSLLFLLSAIAVGFPAVILGSMLASRMLRQRVDVETLSALAKVIPPLLGLYLMAKVIDGVLRESYLHLDASSWPTWAFSLEMVVLALALAMLLTPRIRSSQKGLLSASALVVSGVVVNRLNVVLVAYRPTFSATPYVPSIVELAVTVGCVAGMILVFRLGVLYLPVVQGWRPPKARLSAKACSGGAIGACMLMFVLVDPRAASGLMQPSGGAGSAPSVHADSESGCRTCHTCDQPSTANPCFRPCGRAQLPFGNGAEAGRSPDTVILGELANLYLPVPFDHKGHANMAAMTKGCAACHHYTPEGREHPACKTCHEISPQRADIRKPGLKGAYHRQCLSCHREWGGEESCGICHQPMTGKGAAAKPPTTDDIMGRMHPPITAPDEELYKTRGMDGAESHVLFRHKEHVDRYGLRCAECHREDNCNRCHRNGGPHTQQIRTLDQHHEPCLQCHKDDACERCHVAPDAAPTPPFDHAGTGWELSRYHRDRSCRECHVDVPFVGLKRECNGCHEDWTPANFDHAVTGQLLDERHAPMDCDACHTERRFDLPPVCKDCHENDGIGFPDRRPGAKLGIIGG